MTFVHSLDGPRRANLAVLALVVTLVTVALVLAAPAGAALPAVAATDSSHHAEVALARAIVLWRGGELRAAADVLADLDLSPSATWPRADRAAFLLAVLERRLGRSQALRDKVAAAGDAASPSAYRRWLAHLERWDAVAAGAAGSTPSTGARPLPVEPVLEAALLLDAGRAGEAADLLERNDADEASAAMHLHLLGIALQQAGRDPAEAWRRLAALEPSSVAAARLVATARLQLARSALARGEDPDAELGRVVHEAAAEIAPQAGQARLALALTALDRGDTLTAIAHLDASLAATRSGARHRQALLERGALRGARGEHTAAEADVAAAEADWQRENARLGIWADGTRESAVDSAWAIWAAAGTWERELRPDATTAASALEALAEAALDLRRQPDAEPARLLAAAARRDNALSGSSATAAAASTPSTHQPTVAELDTWRDLHAAVARAEAHRAGLAWEVEGRRRDRDHRLDYLGRGERSARDAADSLRSLAIRHDGLQPRLAQGLVTLRELHDAVLSAVAARTDVVNAALRRNAIYAQAIAHFHVDGPGSRLPEAVDAAAGDQLAQEIDLAYRLGSFSTGFAAQAPDLLGRSLAEAWEPRLRDGNARLRVALVRQDSLAAAIAAGLARLTEHVRADDALAAAEREQALAADRVVVLADSLRGVRLRIAATVAARGQAALRSEREGLDYHLADAAYWHAVDLATDPATAELAALVAPARELAMARLDTFLGRHPQSPVLSEARFRQADLELFRAREAFEARLAGYLDGGDGGAGAARALAPLFDGGAAASLYAAILHDDPAFAHRDAVLFNLGMLKLDSGDRSGLEFLAQLVREHPAAAGVQQAWLRLGDDRFEARDYEGCRAPYEQAAAGADTALVAIALYRLGWARFADDAFAESALAFGRLLDLDTAGGRARDDAGDHARRARGPADLREEALDHLVQALLRAGGAQAFAQHVDHVGARPWDRRTLAAMATQAARYSLDDEAIACDALWLDRYAEDAGALAAAERLVESLERAGRSREAVDARLMQAPRFLPGSAWLAAHDTTGIGDRADRFARRAFAGAAVFEHRAARAERDSSAWVRALAHYEAFLVHWPAAAEAPRLSYQAGEVARELGAHQRSLAHFEAASLSDTADFALDAAWQALAVRDAWYRGTVVPGRPAGDDTLATALLKAGDAFVARYPADARAADLAWRQGQVAYAHGWDLEAARRLLDFSERHAGDAHAPDAARLAGDALYRAGDFTQAGLAYEQAGTLATRSGRRELAAEMAARQPRCAYENAAAVATADSGNGGAAAAALYLDLATRWPAYEHAPAALYKAGLGFAAAGDDTAAIAAWERIVAGDPRGDFGRDAAVRIAETHESAGRAVPAALAWARFSELHPDGDDAPAALLRAIDLREAATDTTGAEALRDDYLRRFPDDVGTAFAIAGSRARRELARALRGGEAIATLATRPAAKRGKPAARPAGAVRGYLDLAEAHPEHADPTLLARIDFLCAEEALRDYLELPLRQPLPKSLEAKNRGLESVVALYNRCVARGDAEHAHAATHRVGEAIIHLGEALLASERPADLAGDDLAAYDEVLREQAWGFTTRGEDAWLQLLRTADRDGGRDPGGWLARTEHGLWPRLALRYVHRPELEYPLAAAIGGR
ncbi:MAG: hypothetical protein IPK64_17330 [bacterium]|nr:hypothetical protein [bacterium]